MPSLQRDPFDYTVVNNTINSVRDLIENSPITAGGFTVDIDPISERRFRNVIEQFDNLGLVSITWTLADNTTTTWTKSQLINTFNAAQLAATVRAAQLHVEANTFKSNPETTYRDLITWAASYGVEL